MPSPVRPLGSPLLQALARSAPTGSMPYRVADRLQRVLARRHLPAPARDQAMLRLDGQLRLVRDVPGVTEDEALRTHLDTVMDATDALGLEPFVVHANRQGRAWVGVVADSLAGLAERIAADRPTAYAEFTSPHGPRTELLCRLGPDDLQGVDTLTVFELVRPSAAIRPFGSRHGCRVERWSRRDGTLTTTGTNPVATTVPATAADRRETRVAGRQVPTLAAFDIVRVDEVAFPIDAVYLWVDGSDPDWQARRDAALAEQTGNHALSTAPSRFREYGELRYSLRSIERFAPWIRHVWLVTDGQRPDWLVDDHPGLTLVDHREIFRDPSVLPTFNSHALSTQLHHIAGLTDHYLVFNDDVLLGRPVEPEAFFEANGVAKFFLSRATVPAGPITDDDLPHEAARKRSRDLVRAAHGQTPTRAFKHTPIAQVRQLHELLEERYAAEYQRTASHRFRSVQDAEVVSWLHHYAGFFERWARPAGIQYDYFNVGDRAALERMEARLAGRSVDCFCVNDTEDGDTDLEERLHRLTGFFERLLPDPSSFERDGR